MIHFQYWYSYCYIKIHTHTQKLYLIIPMTSMRKLVDSIPYSQKYWWELNFGGWARNCHCKNIGGFKFGGLVRDRYTYICEYEISADINLAVAQADRQTAKFNSPPNFLTIQYIILRVCTPRIKSSYSQGQQHNTSFFGNEIIFIQLHVYIILLLVMLKKLTVLSLFGEVT